MTIQHEELGTMRLSSDVVVRIDVIDQVLPDSTALVESQGICAAMQKLSADLIDTIVQMESVTRAELVALRGAGKLVPGRRYRITDYAATTNGDMESQSANHPFDIIVTAEDEQTLNEHARAVMHDGDLPDDVVDGKARTKYFAGCDLAAWDVWYCVDNDASRFAWASNAGNGVIYRMIDEFGNDCPYDFKGIQFNNKFTFDAGNGVDASLNKNGIKVYGNAINPSYENNKQTLNNIVFNCGNDECYSNSFGYNCFNNTFASYCYSNVFGDRFVGNSVDGAFYSNKFGYDCTGNTFNGACQSNTIGSLCDNNTFVSSSKNTIGSNCNRLTFKNCSSNTVGNDCSALILGVDNGVAEENKIGDECKSITMLGGCRRNVIGAKSSSISFGESCQQNTIGAWCRGITFGDSCGDNTLGSNCSKVVVGGSFSHNRVGNYCRLSAGNDCARNEFAGSNMDIAFGNGCKSNRFGVGCTNITFGTKSKIRSNYCDNVIENGNSYIQLDAVNVEDGSGDVYRFVTVKPGVNVANDSGGITTWTITDTNKNQTRQTVYQSEPVKVINLADMARNADLIHRWSFNNSLEDTGSIGGMTAVLGGEGDKKAALTDNGTVRVNATDNKEQKSWVELGADPIPSDLGDTPFTIEVWATVLEARSYASVFALGARSDSSVKGLMGVFHGYRQVKPETYDQWGPCMNPIGGTVDGVAGDRNIAMAPTALYDGVPSYFAYVVTPDGDGNATVEGYVYDTPSKTLVGKSGPYKVTGWTTAQLVQSTFNLGTTPWNNNNPGADYDEVRVWKKALTANQIQLNVEFGPDAVFH